MFSRTPDPFGSCVVRDVRKGVAAKEYAVTSIQERLQLAHAPTEVVLDVGGNVASGKHFWMKSREPKAVGPMLDAIAKASEH